ncbi:MAG: hypothetical protein GQ574_09465 [Crocinitomix sp.]|nr:hypothetical protein [Crocinitomix sp.]
MSNTVTTLADELNNSYPVFEANQLLTSTHLNQLRTYLDVQDRLSRVKLVGMGIVCGLEVSYDSNVISISGGTGVTSQGFLVEIPESNFPKCTLASYFDPENYAPFITEAPTLTGQIPMYELLPSGATEPATLEVINFNDSDFAGFLEDKVVVLFVEFEDIDLESCLGQNCDDRGISRKFTIRRLLLNCDDVDAIIKSGYNIISPQTLDGNFNQRFNQNYAAMPSASLIPHNTLPANFNTAYQSLNTAETLQDRFEVIFPNLALNPLRGLDTLITEAYQRFSPLLQNLISITQINDLQTDFDAFLAECKTNNTVQYYYDFAKDIIKAYNEFFDGAFDLTAECCPDQDAFKRHLVLGKVKAGFGCPETEDECRPKLYRTHFIQSPIYNQQKDKLAEVRNNFKRLVEMISGFQTSHPAIGPLKVTPSDEKQHLLEYRSIPFYYSVAPLFKYWNYNLSKKCRSEWNLGYNADAFDVPNDSSQYPLAFCKDKHNFYRIEGLLNKPHNEIREQLEILKRKYQLEFDVMALKLQKGVAPVSHKANCGIIDIKEDYLQLRNEIIAETKKYSWLLSKFFYFISNASDIMASIFKEGVVVTNQKTHKETPFVGAASDTGLETGGAPDLSIFADVLQSINEVEELVNAMPICIEDFNYDEFKNAFKELQELSFVIAVSFENVIRKFYTGNSIALILMAPLIQNFIERFFLVNFGFIGSIYDLNDILRSHWDVKMKSIYFSYKKRLDAIDNAKLFSNFAKNNPGLEHMAGVPIGGTFIMAYESETSPNVVMDYALHGKPCCIDYFPMCNENAPKYPPVAKNVYFFLNDKIDQGVPVYIDVLEFAIDLNEPTETLDLAEFPVFTTEQQSTMKGIPVRIHSEVLGRAVVEYTSTNNFDLGIDKFEFTVVNDRGETDTACVFVTKAIIGGNIFLTVAKKFDDFFNTANDADGEQVELDDGGLTGPGGAYDYSKELRGHHLNGESELAKVYAGGIAADNNKALIYIGKTEKELQTVIDLGELASDATAEDKKVYELAVINSVGILMEDTKNEIQELEVLIGVTPTNPKEALQHGLRNAQKINEKEALISLYGEQTERLRKIVESQDLATDVDSEMYKFIDLNVRAQGAVIHKHTTRINDGFVAYAGKDGINATRKDLFGSFNG